MKTNRQIATECAEAAWSWLCDRYGLPSPAIQRILNSPSSVSMPSFRISMTRKRPFYVPGVPATRPGEVVISGTSLLWLPNCRTNNSIESWTLQFVGEFTRSIELQSNWNFENLSVGLTHKAVLNQMEFAKTFFPHLTRKHKQGLSTILKEIRAEEKKLQKGKQVPRHAVP
jgi:hypothetical protein